MLPCRKNFNNPGPWNHLLVGGIGAYVGYNMTSWEDSMLQNINEQRARRNMVPISRESLGHFKYPSSTQQEN